LEKLQLKLVLVSKTEHGRGIGRAAAIFGFFAEDLVCHDPSLLSDTIACTHGEMDEPIRVGWQRCHQRNANRRRDSSIFVASSQRLEAAGILLGADFDHSDSSLDN